MKKTLAILLLGLLFSNTVFAESYYFKKCKLSNAVLGDYIIDISKKVIKVTLTTVDGTVQNFSDKIKIIGKDQIISEKIESGKGDQIYFEYYLNSIYWGSGAYGIKSASYEYFDKNVDKLTLHEAATLVVIIRSPAYYNPRKYPERVLERRNSVLETMLRENFIVEVQYRAAKIAPLNIASSKIL